MSEFNEGPSVDSDDALEQLLSHATVRPTPDSHEVAAARDAVYAEWKKVNAGRRSRRQLTSFAVAASVLIAVVSVVGLLRAPDVDLVRVAAIQKSFGAIYLLSDRSELQQASGLSTVHAGQTIVTGNDAGVALAWASGGIVRLDENTKVEFQDERSIVLRSGRIYFDSRPAELISGATESAANAFIVITDQGSVTHKGTQFMAHVEADALTVSVREGRVSVDGGLYAGSASQGEQIVFRSMRRPTVLNINEYGGAWEWIEQTSPSVNVDGKSVYMFLEWVCRELGLELKFVGDTVEQAVRDERLIGRVDAKPEAALRMRMATTAFTWRVADGVIYVSDNE